MQPSLSKNVTVEVWDYDFGTTDALEDSVNFNDLVGTAYFNYDNAASPPRIPAPRYVNIYGGPISVS